MIPLSTGLGLSLFLVAFAAAAFIYTKSRKRIALPYPPGPRKRPVLGNLLDLPTSLEWQTFAKWSKEYNSAIIHLSAAGYDLIVLNTFDAAIDLMEKRSANYSSRPGFTMINELVGWDWFLASMPYGEPWRERRRAFAKYFQNGNTTIYRKPQMETVYKMLPRLLESPEDFLSISQQAVSGMALSLAYGLSIEGPNDPIVHLAEKSLVSVAEAAVPGAFLVDIFPILKYVPEFVPGASFKTKAREWRIVQEEMREVPYKQTVRNMASGVAKPSFTSVSLQNLNEGKDVRHQRDVIRDTAASIFAAGAESTTAVVHTFFAAMLCNPEAQKKAQQELDRTVEGRLPEFSDEQDLPYISALVKEVIRWKPVGPLGGPRLSGKDDVYNGYYVPKGAVIIANLWAMLHDEDIYPDPSAFKPERFLKNGQLNPHVRDPALIAFGFGRRTCPGKDIAQSVLWLTCATILATFDISRVIDDHGKPIEPLVEYHSVTVRCLLRGSFETRR